MPRSQLSRKLRRMPQRKMARVLMSVVSSSLADFLFALSNVVLIAGAAAVLVGTIGSIKMGAVREQFANERISANEAATSAANARAAEANAHAAELELKVAEARKLAGPRNIRDEDRVQMVRVLSQFRGTPYGTNTASISDRWPVTRVARAGVFHGRSPYRGFEHHVWLAIALCRRKCIKGHFACTLGVAVA